MDAREEQQVRWRRRPGWSRPDFWRAPIGPIYVATLVLSVGKGAWYACWAMFYLRSIGLSPAQFGFGITAAGVVGMVAGMPFGYLADRVGPREVLFGLTLVRGLAILSLALVDGFWAVMLVTCVVVMVERAAPGIRIAVISGLTSGPDRLKALSNTHVMKESGAVVGSLIGGVILFFDTQPAYLVMVLLCGGTNLAFALLLLRVPHVESLRERRVTRKVLVLRDRPFLVLTALSGVLALNWGVYDSGLPIWLTTHTHAPPWTMGALMVFNGIVIVLLLNRFTQAAATVPSASRLAVVSGVVLALSCAVYATTDGGTGVVVIALLFAGAAVHTVGELFVLGSGYGLSVGMTKEDAHGEYQGMYGLGEGTAMMLAPGLLTALLSGWGVAGWLLLGALFLVAGAGLLFTGRWSVREQQRGAEPAGPPADVKAAA
ncbi:MFS transporter [Amycolatopsis sp. CA-128772]|uniref:MFS transporter n=1 Tax=Amycolatopsis sp. CA-128772 TaxID=2073159 RepID=UPI0011B0882F|nr:MFS transporter [Amycolatopsis sp. CA-128772]